MRERRGPAGDHAGAHCRAAGGLCYTMNNSVSGQPGRVPPGRELPGMIATVAVASAGPP